MEIATIRTRLGMTRREFGAALGYSARAVTAWEQGWRPVLPRVEKAALALLLVAERSSRLPGVTHPPPSSPAPGRPSLCQHEKPGGEQ